MAKTNQEVIDAFLSKRPAKSGRMSTDGMELKSYATVVAFHQDNQPDSLWITAEKFSPTTAAQVSMLGWAAINRGWEETASTYAFPVEVEIVHTPYFNNSRRSRNRQIDNMGDGKHTAKFRRYVRGGEAA